MAVAGNAPVSRVGTVLELPLPTILAVHVGCVLASAGLFALRGGAALAGAGWTMARPLRLGSYAVDTVLLGAGVALAVMTRQYPFVQPWLTTKLLLLVLYIVLGSFALKRGRTRTVRAGCFAAALLVLALIAGIAIAHDPPGWLATPAG
jgi:uncharacterized membrane protein SirB2